jgi:hypothetical protein
MTPIPSDERAVAVAALHRLQRLVPPVEEILERDWGSEWRDRVATEIGASQPQLHDERQLLRTIAKCPPALRLFPRHGAEDFRRLNRIANEVFHNDGSRWETGKAAMLECTVADLLDAAAPTQIAAVAMPGSALEVWRVRPDGVVEHRWTEPSAASWTDWRDFHDTRDCRALAAVSYGRNHIELFMLDAAHQTHHRWWQVTREHPNGAWFPWTPLFSGQRVSGPLSAASRHPGHILLVASSLDGEPVRAWRKDDGSWQGWHAF